MKAGSKKKTPYIQKCILARFSFTDKMSQKKRLNSDWKSKIIKQLLFLKSCHAAFRRRSKVGGDGTVAEV